MIGQRELHQAVSGPTGVGASTIVEEQQPRRLHFEVLLMGDSYPLNQVVTHLVENAMRTYPAGCEIIITSRV